MNKTIDYAGNTSQSRLNRSDGFEHSPSNDEEDIYSEDEQHDEYGLRENSNVPKKGLVKRDLSYEQIRMNQMPPRSDSNPHMRSLQQHVMSKTLSDSDKSLKRPSFSNPPLKM